MLPPRGAPDHPDHRRRHPVPGLAGRHPVGRGIRRGHGGRPGRGGGPGRWRPALTRPARHGDRRLPGPRPSSVASAPSPSVPVIMVTARGRRARRRAGPRGRRRRPHHQAPPAPRADRPHPGRAAPGGPSRAQRRVDHPSGVYTLGPVRIDVSLPRGHVRGRDVELSRKEFDLLALLVSEAGNVVTRNQCMERIWRDRTKGDSRTLDTHVKRLRKKIELDSGRAPARAHGPGDRLPLQAVGACPTPPFVHCRSPHWSLRRCAGGPLRV